MIVIVNPQANHGQAASLLPAVREAARGWNAEVVVTERWGHASDIARQTSAGETVVVVGGDGTVFEVVNGLTESENHRAVLGIIPAGSGNDLAKSLGIPKAFAASADIISAGHTRLMDLGRANGRVYTNSLATGFDARVAHLANEIKEETEKTGLSLYLTALFRIVFGDFYCHQVRIKIDDGDWMEKEILLAAVNNGSTYGGGFRITPEADNADGLLEVCVIDGVPRWQVLWRLPFVIAGRHKWMKQVSFYKAGRVKIESEQPLPAALDGELILSNAYEVKIIPGALNVIVP